MHGSGGVAEGMKTSRALVGVGRAVEGECRATWGKKQRRGVVVGEGELKRMAAKKVKKGKAKAKKVVLEEGIGAAEGVAAEEATGEVTAEVVERVGAGTTAESGGTAEGINAQPVAMIGAESGIDAVPTGEISATEGTTASSTSSEIAAAIEEQTKPTTEGEANPSVEADAAPEADNVPATGSMPEWSQIMRVRVGSFLVDRLMESAVVTRQGVDSEGNA